MPALMVRFVATAEEAAPATSNSWCIKSVAGVTGPSLGAAKSLAVVEGEAAVQSPAGVEWSLLGAVGALRYTTRDELRELQAKQAGLGRDGCTLAALIPIKKREEWWALTQDERRSIIGKGHIGAGKQLCLKKKIYTFLKFCNTMLYFFCRRIRP